jgi:iron(III) transport system substrate-binding protein
MTTRRDANVRGKIHRRLSHGYAPLAGALAVLLVLSACGSSGKKKLTAATGGTASTAAPVNSAWQQTIDAAKKEGTVTIYSSQGLDQLNNFASKFQAKYGIHVEVVRGIDGDLNTKIEAEKQTGHGIADMWVNASQSVVQAKGQQGGWFVPATGPNFDTAAYNKAQNYHQGDYFEVGAAILTFGWNTQLYPKGLKDYPDLLDPALKGGKIGVIQPTASSIVDFYQYLEQNYGADFVAKLAAQKPRIYPSSLPMGQALTSGEISAAAFVQVQGDNKAAGAPVDSGLANQAWGARFWGMLLKTAPHPNAAQLLADFMITPVGQQAVMHNASTVLPNIPGAVTSDDKVRKQDLTQLTPDKVTAYQAKWASLFK